MGALGLRVGFVGLLVSAGLMAMRLYKVYDVVMTSHKFVVIQTLSVTVDHHSCYKFTKFWLHSGLDAGNIVGLKGLVWLVRYSCRR